MSGDEARLAELDEKASALRRRLEELNTEAERWRSERDRLNDSRNVLRAEALSHREGRDRANQQVAEIKQKIGSLRDELYGRRAKLAEFGDELGKKLRKLPPKREVASRIGEIDWELMTTPTVTMLPREKEISEEARGLRKELEAHRELDSKKDEELIIMADIKALELEIKRLRDETTRLHQMSEENHKQMLLLREKVDEEKRQADKAHSKFREVLSAMKTAKGELGEVLKEARDLHKKSKESEKLTDAERRLIIEAKKKELTAEAKRKLEAGEKLSLEELKLVYEGEDEEEE